jgi:hypothetical protein
MLQRLLVKIYGPDWKTSLNGDLAFIIWFCTLLSGVTITANWPHWVIAIPGTAGTIAAIGRAIVGRKQTDAGKVVIHGEDGHEIVPSHEVPDVKGDKPVIPQP